MNSLKHAGTPWEIGLAETQQTLLLNGLRDRITVQVDGAMKTGRDVVIAALLGAEEYGFATAPLVVAGCIMMRVCHLDTCPVGVATQNPVLRKRYTGQAGVRRVNFFQFVAEEVRETLAALGFRTLDEAIGHAELLDTDEAVDHWKASGLDLAPIFEMPTETPLRSARSGAPRGQDHGLEHALDRTLIQLAEAALEDAHPVRLELPVRNVNRTVGTLLGSEVTRRYGGDGLPEDTIHVTLTGSAGQSLGAFLPRGITLDMVGDANDYVGKGLSGGRIIVRPDPRTRRSPPRQQMIAGNTIGYGATGGEIFLRGQVGERFCVRNSGGHGRRRGRRRPRLRVHDRRPRRGARARPGATWRPACPAASRSCSTSTRRRSTRTWWTCYAPDRATICAGCKKTVQRHHELTGSAVAASLLGDWPRRSVAFTKVMPRDYQRVLERRRRPAPPAATSTRRSWRPPVADPTGFLKYDRDEPPKKSR